MSKRALHYTKIGIGDAGGVPLQRYEPAEIGAVNMGETGAVRKRSR